MKSAHRPQIVFDKNLKKRCAEHIRNNLGTSVRKLFSEHPDRPANIAFIVKAYCSISNFLKEIGIKLCELNHIGFYNSIDKEETFYSKLHGKLRILKIIGRKGGKSYHLSNGNAYKQGVLVRYLDLNAAYPDKKIDVQEFSKIHEMIKGAKSRALKKNIRFDLSALYLYELYNFVLPLKCEVFENLNLNYYNQIAGQMKDSPSLDRIKPELGYTKGNVRIISHKFNAYCSDMDIESCINVLKYKIGPGKSVLIINSRALKELKFKRSRKSLGRKNPGRLY